MHPRPVKQPNLTRKLPVERRMSEHLKSEEIVDTPEVRGLSDHAQAGQPRALWLPD